MKNSFTATLALLVFAATCPAQSTYETKPDIHGDTVVFTAEGDLWLGSISNGGAKRITSDPGSELNPRFSPDGKWLAFTGEYEGGQDVYLMPVEGGAPKRLTYDPRGALVQGWTPDGKWIIYRSRRSSPVGGIRRLFKVPATGGNSIELPIPRAEFGSMGPNGLVAYVPVSFEWANWFHYQGGAADDIWLTDTKTASFKRLTDYPGVDTTPVWCGGKIYFVSERNGWSNLWEIEPGSKAVKQCTHYGDAPVRYPSSDGTKVIFQHGARLAVYDPSTGRSSDVSLALDSDRVHSREQRISLASEVGPFTYYANSGYLTLGSGISLGPTGKRLLVEARGQIISLASEAGDMRVLEKKPGTRARFPAWSADGKKFAFISDRSGENEVWIGNATGGSEPTQLTHGLRANPFPPSWSPDGKWLALTDRTARLLLVDTATGTTTQVDQADRFSSYDATVGTWSFSPDSKYLAFSRVEQNWLFSVNLYEINTGKKARLSDLRLNSYAPVFDTTGKFVVFLSDAHLSPIGAPITGKYYYDNPTIVEMVALTSDAKSPFLPKNDEEGIAADQADKADKKQQASPAASPVEWNGLSSRLIQVPLPPGRYSQLDAIPGKLLLLNQSQNFGSSGPERGIGEFLLYDLESRKATPVISGIDYFQKSFDNKRILFTSGSQISVHDISAQATSMSDGAVNLAPYSITYDPVPEWHQVFLESWRIARDFYFDPNMAGLDWNAVRRKYEASLSNVGDRGDLTRLLSDMVSELNTGHAYITYTAPTAHPQNMGFLGIDVEAVPGANALKIKKLYRGDAWNPGLHSPLLDPGIGVKEGDYILQIAGQEVSERVDMQALLLGTRGQTVALMVNEKPSREGAKVIRIRPLASENELRYQDWVEGRIRYVEEHGGPNFGYAHISDMNSAGLVGFAKAQFPNVSKTAMIYDTRFNGGGYISSLLLQDIAASPTAWFKPRYGMAWTREAWAVIGHKVALCNEENFSDGELFIEAWKRMKLGPVVGVRTGGGEVGSGGGYDLIDHGQIYIPNYAAYREGEWIVEGKGASPTVQEEQDPNAVMAGRDPQLDKAIAILKQELAKDPINIPSHPTYPSKTVPIR